MFVSFPHVTVILYKKSSVCPEPLAVDARVRLVCCGIDVVGWVTLDAGLEWGTYELVEYWADDELHAAMREISRLHGAEAAQEAKGAIQDTVTDFLREARDQKAQLDQKLELLNAKDALDTGGSPFPASGWGW